MMSDCVQGRVCFQDRDNHVSTELTVTPAAPWLAPPVTMTPAALWLNPPLETALPRAAGATACHFSSF